jgi:hypothetical protein
MDLFSTVRGHTRQDMTNFSPYYLAFCLTNSQSITLRAISSEIPVSHLTDPGFITRKPRCFYTHFRSRHNHSQIDATRTENRLVSQSYSVSAISK